MQQTPTAVMSMLFVKIPWAPTPVLVKLGLQGTAKHVMVRNQCRLYKSARKVTLRGLMRIFTHN